MGSQMEESLKQVGEVECDSSPMLSSTFSKQKHTTATATATTASATATFLRSRSMGASSSSTTTTSIPLQRSRSTARRMKTRKTICLLSRKQQPNDIIKDKKTASKAKANDDNYISIGSTHQKSITDTYQPKKFSDIVGNEITVTAISNAIEKKRIAPLYLFHGPSGTGKSSTARIFTMASNCESDSSVINKPCWSCTGCTRSLYIMDYLYSGNSTISGFHIIKTLLFSTVAVAQSVPGFKVLIIEDAEKWDEHELLSIVQKGSSNESNVVFVLITGAVNEVPISISSRCQKFGFPKLRDKDIALKLEKIEALEDLRIEREAMKLIIAKSEGSLREAENILDQLALLGSTITSSMVQQLVGLVPQSKLIDLLAATVSGETIKIVRFTKELMITGGVEPRALVSQLSSVIIDILSGASAVSDSKDKNLLRSRSRSADDNQTGRLCCALKILVETERQLNRSSSNRDDQTSGLLSALIEIASQDIISPSRSITLPSDDKPHAESSGGDRQKAEICRGREEAERIPEWARMGDMEKIWECMLERIHSTTNIKAFLSQQAKLASVSVSRANTIVHLMFKTPEDKKAAQMREESISNAIKIATGCPAITVNMSLEPSAYLDEENPILFNQRIPFSPQFGVSFQSEERIVIPTATELRETIATTTVATARAEFDTSEREILTQARTSIDTISQNNSMRMRSNSKPKHCRWLSLSSIPHLDASVEPYSQDILFENANRDRESNGKKNHKPFSKPTTEDHHHLQDPAVHAQVKDSWRCIDRIRQRRQKHES